MPSTFISAETFHNEIRDGNDEDRVIVDCRFYITDPELGYKEYLEAHIPKAIYAHLDKDLSGPINSTTGRHPLPDIKIFKSWLNKNSILPTKHIMLYDQLGGGIAARLWFMLSQLGFEKVSVLEGGIQEWQNLDYSLEAGESPLITNEEFDYEALTTDWGSGPFKIYHKEELKGLLGSELDIVDSRSPERYTGEEELIDPVAGHIPSAINLYWQNHLNEKYKLLSDGDLLANMIKSINMKTDTVFYCGSGVTAAFNLLVYYHLMNQFSGIYVGSWSEWIRD